MTGVNEKLFMCQMFMCLFRPPLWARSVPKSVRQGVPEMGVSEGVSYGVSPDHFGPQARECQKGVLRVCPECQDSFLTLAGHLFDTLEPGARSTPETSRGTLPQTPPFSRTPCGTLSGKLRAQRARMTLLAGRGFPNLGISCGVTGTDLALLALETTNQSQT